MAVKLGINYEIFNLNKSNPIIFLHGWGSNKEIMKVFKDEFEDNKLLFVNLPAYCTLRIYTATGDLIATHYDAASFAYFANKASNPILDNIPVQMTDGNLKDSGKKISDLAKVGGDDAQKFKVANGTGKEAINKASNILSPEQIAMQIKLQLIEQLPSIIEQSVRPMSSFAITLRRDTTSGASSRGG